MNKNLLIETGKLFPQAVDVEEAILGALLLEPRVFPMINQIIKADTFYKEAHKKVFIAINNLFSKSENIDLLTTTNELKEMGELDVVGGAYFITTLCNRVASSANIEFHCRIIAQKYIAREMIRITAEVGRLSYEDTEDVFETLAKLESELLKLKSFETNNVNTIRDAIGRVRSTIDSNSMNQKRITGIPTGFTKYDFWTGGLQNGDMIVISGESGNGKTSFALNVIYNACVNNGRRGVIYSLEMNQLQLAARLCSQATGITSKTLLYNKLENHELILFDSKINKLVNSNIYFDDNSNSKIGSITSSIKNMKLKHDIEFAFIDYLQLISTDSKGRSREQEIADMTRRIKNTARELNIPIMLISNLTKDRLNPRPTLGRLKDSGQIEFDADMVLFLFRPEKYGYEKNDEPFETINSAGTAILEIAKGRNTGTAKFLLNFNPELTLFTDWQDPDTFGNGTPIPEDPKIPAYIVKSMLDKRNNDDAPF